MESLSQQLDDTHILYSLYRQDDNGNEYCIAQHLSKEEAERLCKDYEARAHKQTFWIMPETASLKE